MNCDLVETYEFSDGGWEWKVFSGRSRERLYSQFVLQPGDYDRQAQRIEARFE